MIKISNLENQNLNRTEEEYAKEVENLTWSKIIWKRFRKNTLAMLGGAIVVLLFLTAVAAPFISPYDPSKLDIPNALKPPSFKHFMGTDGLGRDVFSRMIYGAKISLLVGFVSMGLASLIGVILGSFAGYYGGWIDLIISRFIDVMLCFPSFFLILTVIAFLPPSIWNIMIVIGITRWTSVARLVRGEFLKLKEQEFVQAAKALGASDMRIIFVHLLPNSLSPVLVAATLGVAAAILTESGLSFLGLGVQPPTPSWGNILTEGKTYVQVAWWLSTFPGLAIFLTVMGYNLLGEGLRDALDPKLNK